MAELAEPKRARGRPRKTEDERDDGNRRQALISAAAQLFHRKGYDAVSYTHLTLPTKRIV